MATKETTTATSSIFSPKVQHLVVQHMATGLYASADDLLITALHQLAIDPIDEEEVAAIREGLEAQAAGYQVCRLTRRLQSCGRNTDLTRNSRISK